MLIAFLKKLKLVVQFRKILYYLVSTGTIQKILLSYRKETKMNITDLTVHELQEKLKKKLYKKY